MISQQFILEKDLKYLCCNFHATKGDFVKIYKQTSKNRILISVKGNGHKVKFSTLKMALTTEDRKNLIESLKENNV